MVSETGGAGGAAGGREGFRSRREGLTAGDQEKAEEAAKTLTGKLKAALSSTISKCCPGDSAGGAVNKPLFTEFASLLEAAAAQEVKDLSGQAANALASNNVAPLQTGSKKVGDLLSLAASARKLADVGPGSA